MYAIIFQNIHFTFLKQLYINAACHFGQCFADVCYVAVNIIVMVECSRMSVVIVCHSANLSDASLSNHLRNL